MTIDLARCCGGLCPRPAVREFHELDSGLIAELLQFSLDRGQVAPDGYQLALNTGQSPIDVLQLVLHALDDSGDLRDRTEQGGRLLTIH